MDAVKQRVNQKNVRRAILILFIIPQIVLSQESKTDSTENSFFRDARVLPLPIFFRLPETGFAGGIAATSAFNFAKDSSWAKPSQATLGFAYTQKRQILSYLNFSIFFNNNDYFTTGEVGWYRYNYKYFGIGEEAIPAENYAVDYPRVKLLLAKQIKKNHYLGIRYHFEHYNITETDPGGSLDADTIPGSDLSITSSLGFHYLIDTRDKVFYPRKGMFVNSYVLPTLKAFGADRNFNQILIDAAFYKGFKERWVWVNHGYGSFIQGNDVPFSQLSMLGGSKIFRGIFEGRFRDKNILLYQSEIRVEIWRFIGATAFTSVGVLGNEKDFLRFQLPKVSFGGGLRIKLLKDQHLNMRIDYGYTPGVGGNFYITFGEAY